jgi:4-hydroxybenzoate polyprenyltransferase
MAIQINIDAKQTVKHILEKITSGRWITTVFLTGTFCLITLKCIDLFVANLATDKLPLVKEILMFILGAFTTQAGNVITSYFDRSDRKPEQNGGAK